VSLDLSVVGFLWRAEMRMVLRDRRTLVASVLLPLIVMPFLLIAVSWVNRQRIEHHETAVYRYAVTGSQADAVRILLARALEGPSVDPDDASSARPRFEEQTVVDPAAALEAGDLHFHIEAMTAQEFRARTVEQGMDPPDTVSALIEPDHPGQGEHELRRGERLLPGAPVFRLVFRADREESTEGMQRMSRLLRDARRAQRVALLEAHGFPAAPEVVAALVTVNVATDAQVAVLTLGRFLTLFLLLFLLPGAAVLATDSLAGEKERGTLETLLTTAAGRVEIIAAKHLAILSVAIGITCIQAVNLLVYVGFEWIPLPPGLTAAITPGVALLLAFLYLPLAALVAGVLLVTSGYARSYKEAQLYFMPVFLLGLLPALAPFLPGLSLRSVIALVPVANLALAAREILTGRFDWPWIAVAWLINAATALWVLRFAVRFLAVERLMTGTDREAGGANVGPGLFERHVLRWFAGLWAVLLIVNGYYTPETDLRFQAIVNLVVLFLGTTLFLVWRYRLDPRAALALRAPHPMIWTAVCIGVPGGLLTGIGVFRLADRIVPMPPELLESFTQGLVPETIPFWQLLLILAVLPGVIEELTFRGVLLHGLHRRLHPAALVLVVGLIFGLFHVALFRILPTAFLGILFALVTLLSGSLYPVVLWHVLHNACGVLAAQQGWPLDNLDPMAHLAGAGCLAVALWIVWRHRTPYPGLRSWRRKAGASERNPEP
jgi:sodium transport system permease protein